MLGSGLIEKNGLQAILAECCGEAHLAVSTVGHVLGSDPRYGWHWFLRSLDFAATGHDAEHGLES